MMAGQQPKQLGFFTRVLDSAPPAERYRLAAAQIVHAERCGFESAWVAQHHFHKDEGGLPAPMVFLSHVAAQTTRIRLGTGIITLPLELPLRVAENTAVLDYLSGGRLEVGVGPGGNLTAFQAFGLDSKDRATLFSDHLEQLRQAWTGQPLPGGDVLYPTNPGLADRTWQATFTVDGAARAGAAGDGLMLSRTQPRAPGQDGTPLSDIQDPMVDAYLAALPPGRTPRILASRSVFVADDEREALRLAEAGLGKLRARMANPPDTGAGIPLRDIIAAFDVHVGTPEQVIESLQADRTLARATHFTVQVHSVDPPHPFILRSIELVADVVGPALGCVRADDAPDSRAVRRVA